MKDHFREDENELPYLLFEKRDDFKAPQSKKASGKSLDEVLSSLYISPSQRLKLKNKLVEFLNAKDCVGLEVRDDFGGCEFVLTRKNKYVETTHTFEYYPDFDLERIFKDAYTSHSYDGLLRDLRFRKLVVESDLMFVECSGGYVCNYSAKDDEFSLTDEPEVKVIFDTGLKRRMYDLDLDKMELGDYWEYRLE